MFSGPLPTITSPPSRTVPWVGVSAPAMVMSVVDLPAPLGPTRVTISPSFTVRLTPRTAGMRP